MATNQLEVIQPTRQFETVNLLIALAGTSAHTQRAYKRWIARYLADINKIDAATIDLSALDVALAASSLRPAMLKAWLGLLKEGNLGKQSLQQAKAAVVFLAQVLADLGAIAYTVPHGLSRVKAPRAESGQREGTWLTSDEVKHLIQTLREYRAGGRAIAARDTAIVVLMVTCGLRCDEVITLVWSDLSHQGDNAVIRVHGKGEKLRVVKLPDMAAKAIDGWKKHYPTGSGPVFRPINKKGQVLEHALSDSAIRRAVKLAGKRAGLPPISPHDLRRTFARGAYEAGGSFELIRQALGHSNIATTEHYVKAAVELDRAATDIWTELIQNGL
jgi:integrase